MVPTQTESVEHPRLAVAPSRIHRRDLLHVQSLPTLAAFAPTANPSFAEAAWPAQHDLLERRHLLQSTGLWHLPCRMLPKPCATRWPWHSTSMLLQGLVPQGLAPTFPLQQEGPRLHAIVHPSCKQRHRCSVLDCWVLAAGQHTISAAWRAYQTHGSSDPPTTKLSRPVPGLVHSDPASDLAWSEALTKLQANGGLQQTWRV